MVERKDEIRAPVSSKTEAPSGEPKVSALSSIRAKRALEESNKAYVKEGLIYLPRLFRNRDVSTMDKYAKRLGDKGFKIMESLLLINDPNWF
jgi:hypothetical protein